MMKIKKELNLTNFMKALFFDDNANNISDTSKLGVTSILVRQDGLDLKTLFEGLTAYDHNARNLFLKAFNCFYNIAICNYLEKLNMEANLEDKVYDEDLINHWNSLSNRPKVIVFDLDYTLWPYFIDQHVQPPIDRRIKDSVVEITDKYGNGFKSYKDVNLILRTLKEKCLGNDGHLAIASKSTTGKLAMQAIEFYGWKEYLSSFQIYYITKSKHMNEIKKELGFESFEEVLFFDDDRSNVPPTRQLGVLPFLVDSDGLTKQAMINGLTQFNDKQKK